MNNKWDLYRAVTYKVWLTMAQFTQVPYLQIRAVIV